MTTDTERNELIDAAAELGLSEAEAELEVDDYLGMMGGVSLEPLPEPEGHCPDILTDMLTRPAFMLSYVPHDTDPRRTWKRWSHEVFMLDARAEIEGKVKTMVDEGTIDEFKATVVTGTTICPRCDGNGVTTLAAMGSYPARDVKCLTCNGDKTFDAPLWADIAPGLFTKRNGKVSLRKSPPNDTSGRRKNRTEARRYYVWRMARFNGGVDVHMPMEANWVAGGDPWEPVLDVFADAVALVSFGSRTAGADRWAAALGYTS